MGNAFSRPGELDLAPALSAGIPMLSSVLELLGKSSGQGSGKLGHILEHLDPELIGTLIRQFSTTRPGRE